VRDLAGKVAVVTGAASGIGRALADAFAAEGMRVVLADVEQAALDDAAHAVAKTAPAAIAVRTDVSKAADVEALADAAERAFGGVQVVCNNAGVALSGLSWQHTLADWEWVLGVNLWGVIHGIRTFVPRLLAATAEAHVVNTGSIAGLLSGPGMAVYGASKHGVVTISESLHYEFAMLHAPIGVSVLCPAAVATRIMDAARNRPSELTDAPSIDDQAKRDAAKASLAAGMAPERVAACVVDAIRSNRFWVLSHPEWREYVRIRLEDVLHDRNPSPEAIAGLVNPGTPTGTPSS
jgi:NAD(P)-dependent dehydrogenase (short-subunit alcohol dehydrogenase family)